MYLFSTIVSSIKEVVSDIKDHKYNNNKLNSIKESVEEEDEEEKKGGNN
jgi:hypothetical protein